MGVLLGRPPFRFTIRFDLGEHVAGEFVIFGDADDRALRQSWPASPMLAAGCVDTSVPTRRCVLPGIRVSILA